MRYLKRSFFFIIIYILLFSYCIPVYAVNTKPTAEQKAAAEERKFLTVESNEWKGWPEGPVLGAEAAILMDFNTDTILYSKNIHEQLYPASTTKMMTALLTI